MMMVVVRCWSGIILQFGLGFGAFCFGWLGEGMYISYARIFAQGKSGGKLGVKKHQLS